MEALLRGPPRKASAAQLMFLAARDFTWDDVALEVRPDGHDSACGAPGGDCGCQERKEQREAL